MPGSGKCLNTPDERCACQARRLRSEGWGRTYPLFFWLGGALLDLIGGLLEQFGAVEPKFSKKNQKNSKMGRARKMNPTEHGIRTWQVQRSSGVFREPPGSGSLGIEVGLLLQGSHITRIESFPKCNCVYVHYYTDYAN